MGVAEVFQPFYLDQHNCFQEKQGISANRKLSQILLFMDDCNYYFSCPLVRADVRWVHRPRLSAHSKFFATVWLSDLII